MATESTAQRADYIAFLHRTPFATDAYHQGFATGVREDYSLRNYQFEIVDVPVWMLDNDFRNPDLDRYLDVLDATDPTPRVGVIGDAYTRDDAERFLDVAADLRDRHDEFEPIIVPKCRGALDILPANCLTGYPLGYSEKDPEDIAPVTAWRSTPGDTPRPIHILGGTPTTAWEAIRNLTDASNPEQTDLSTFGVASTYDAARADVVGLDWNGLVQTAFVGDYWRHESPHWQPADHLSIRETVKRGLSEVRRYWQERGVWPAVTPNNRLGAPVEEADPADAVRTCAGCGCRLPKLTDVHRCREFGDGVVRAFCSRTCQNHVVARMSTAP